MNKGIIIIVFLIGILLSSGCIDDVIEIAIPEFTNIDVTEPDVTEPDVTEPEITESVTKELSSIPIELDSWVKVNTGEWEKTADGIRSYGAGPRMAAHQGLQSKNIYNFLNSETYIKWKANGGNGNYGAFWVLLMNDYDTNTASNNGLARGGFFTTQHTYKSSVLITEDEWYYSRIKVNADGSYTAVTSKDNYDDNGGTALYSDTGNFDNANKGTIVVILQDNYGGTEAYLVVGEVKTSANEISSNGATTVTNGTTLVTNETTTVINETTGDGGDGDITTTLPLSNSFEAKIFPSAITFDGSNLWVTASAAGGGTVTKFNLDGTVVGKYNVGSGPNDVIYTNGYIWVANNADDTVTKLDTNGNIIGTYDVGAYPRSLVAEGENVWVANFKEGNVMKLSSVGENLLTYTAPGVDRKPVNLVYDGTNIWIGNHWGLLDKVDAAQGQTLPGYKTGGYISGLTFDGTDIYVVIWHDVGSTEIRKYTTGWVHLVDFKLPDVILPSDIFYDGLYLWVTDSNQNKILKISPDDGTIYGTYDTDDGPIDIGFDGTNIWVVNTRANTIQKIARYK